MSKWIPVMLVAAAFLSACKKSETPKTDDAADTAMVLPAPPELEPIEDAFPEPEPVAVPEQPVRKADPAKGIAKDGPYTLQVGIYNLERQAQRLAEKLKKQGFPAYVARVENPTPALTGTYYRVRIGSFASSKAAREYGQANLAPEGIAFWADLKGRDSQPVKQVFAPQKTAPAAAPTPPAYQSSPAPPTEPAQDTRPAPKLPDW